MAYTLLSSSKFPTSTTALTATRNMVPNTPANTDLIVLAIASAGTTARLGGAPTYNGTAFSKVATPYFPYSASADEGNCELWYYLNPTSTGLQTISVPRTAGSYFTTTIWASCGNLSSSTYVSSSVRTATSANPNVTMSALPAQSGSIFYASVSDNGDNNPATTWRQLRLQNTDVGTWNWDVQCQSASLGTSVIIFGDNHASETWAYILGAWGEQANTYKTYTMVVGGDDMRQ